MLQHKTCRAHLLQRDGFDHRPSGRASGGAPRTPKRRRKGQSNASPVAQVEAHISAAAVAAEAIASAVGASRGKPREERPIHWTAVHWAAHCGHVGILQMLLKECHTPQQGGAVEGEGLKISEADWTLLLRIAKEQLEPLYLFTLTKKQRARERKAQALEEERGQLYSWGSGAYYALGNGTDQRRQEPRRVQAFSDGSVDLCAASKFVTLVRCSNASEEAPAFAPGHQLWAWGTGFAGQLGHGEEHLVQTLPLAIQPASFSRRRVASLAAGREHSAFATADGALYTFGAGGRGQLGNGTVAACSSPSLLKAFRKAKVCVRSVYCGAFHTLAVTRSGTLYAWGAGTKGQTGLSVLEDVAHPMKVPTFATSCVILVAAGTEHTVMVCDDMDVFLTGFGQCVPQRMRLPQGYPSAINEKVRAASVVDHEASLLSITSLAAGNEQSILCTNRGEVYYHLKESLDSESPSDLSLVLQSLSLPCTASLVSCGGLRTAVVVPQYQEVWEWPSVEKLQEEAAPRKLRLAHVSALVLSPKHSLAICRARKRRTRVPIPSSTLAKDILSARGLFTDALILPGLEPQEAVPLHRAMLATCAGEKLERDLECSSLVLVALHCSKDDVETFVAELYGALPGHQERAVAAARVASAVGCTEPHTWPHISERMSSINRATHHDMEWIVGGSKVLYGNRFVAAARSRYFRCLLVKGFNEGGSTSLQLNVSTNACEALLEYLYSDKISIQGEGEELLEVFMVAKYLCLDRLIALCERLMAEELTCPAVPLMFDVASSFHSKALREELLRYSMQNLAELLSSGSFTRIPASALQELQLRIDTAIERLLESQREEGLAREHLVLMGNKLGLPDDTMEEAILGLAGRAPEAALKEERSVRKKLAQVELLREKARRGLLLNDAQRSKLHQRRPLLAHLSTITTRAADDLAKEIAAAALAPGGRSPHAYPLSPSPSSSPSLSPSQSPSLLPLPASRDLSPELSPGVLLQSESEESPSRLVLSPTRPIASGEATVEFQESRAELERATPSSWQELATDDKEETTAAPPLARGVGRKARRRLASKKKQQQQQQLQQKKERVSDKSGEGADAAWKVSKGSVDRPQQSAPVEMGSPVRSFREIQEEERRANGGKRQAKKQKPGPMLNKSTPTVTLYYGSSPASIGRGQKGGGKGPKVASPPPSWAGAGSPPVKSVLQLQQEEEQKKRRQRAQAMRDRQQQRAAQKKQKKAEKWSPGERENSRTLSLAEIQREEEEERRRRTQRARPSMRAILEEEQLRARRARPTVADIEEEMLALALQASLADQ